MPLMSAQDYLAETLGADITPDMPAMVEMASMAQPPGLSGMSPPGSMPDGGPPPTSIDDGFGAMEGDPDAPPTNIAMPPPTSESGAPIAEVMYADGTSWVAPSAGGAETGF